METPSVLFVCHGNICRSPMAEFVMKELVREEGIQCVIESCATSTEELGCDMYPPAKRVLEAHSIPFTQRRARQMDPGDYGRFDMIVVMDSQNLRNIRPFVHGDPDGKVRKLMSYAGKDTDVADPWYSGDFERTYQDVVEGCRGILRVLRTLG